MGLRGRRRRSADGADGGHGRALLVVDLRRSPSMQASFVRPALAVIRGSSSSSALRALRSSSPSSPSRSGRGRAAIPHRRMVDLLVRHLFGLTPPRACAAADRDGAHALALPRLPHHGVSTVLGVMSAQAFRRRFKGSGAAFYLIVLGMMVPGVRSARHRPPRQFGIHRHWWSTAFVAARGLHLPLRLPGHAGDLQPLDAWSGGPLAARRAADATFRKITFPLIFPGVLSAMLFAFTLSV